MFINIREFQIITYLGHQLYTFLDVCYIEGEFVDIRCQKQPSLVRDAFSEAYRAKSSTCRTGRIFSARNSPRSEVIRHKKRVTSKSIKTF